MRSTMSGPPTSTPTLTDLPESILQQIAFCLPPPDTVDLARTHSALTAASESSIWSELNISLQRSFLPRPQPDGWTRPLGGNMLYQIRQLQTWEHPLKYTHALEAYFISLEAHLRADDRRRKAVRKIYIDIDRLLHLRFADILKLVAPTVRRLEFIALDFPRGAPMSPHPSFPTIRQLFESSLQIRLDRLTHLVLPLDTAWDETIPAVLKRTPHLTSLVLTMEQPWSGGWGERVVYRTADILQTWPVLPYLRHLRVDEFQQAFYPMLEWLVASAPDLERVSLEDPCRVMKDSQAVSLFHALSTRSKLRYLACPSAALTLLVSCKWPKSLDEISMRENLRRWDVPFLEATTIPPVPGMKLFHSHARISEDSLIWTWHHDSCPLPPALLPISSETLRSIHAAEDLLMIQSSGSSGGEVPLPQSVDEWEAHEKHYGIATTRAVLIRTYTPSDRTAATSTPSSGVEGDLEVFTHCRSFGAEQCQIDDGYLQRSQAVWTEHVDYCGLQLPGNILAEVYAILGETAGWKVPGRNKKLPEAAWGVLRGFKQGVAEALAVGEDGVLSDQVEYRGGCV